MLRAGRFVECSPPVGVLVTADPAGLLRAPPVTPQLPFRVVADR